jgi:hypothetical protein
VGAFSTWTAWLAALLCVASCAAPAGAQTKIINGEPMLGWVNGTYEKPVIIEVVGDSNATTGTAASAPDTSNDNHYYHSIYTALLKWSPYTKLGGMEIAPFTGENFGLYGRGTTSGSSQISQFANGSVVTIASILPGQATPGGTTTGIHLPAVTSSLYTSDRGDGTVRYWTMRPASGGSWCVNDPDWWYDGRALEVKAQGLLTTDGLDGLRLRSERGGTEASNQAVLSGSSITDTTINFAGTEAHTTFGASVAGSTTTMLRFGINTTSLSENAKRWVLSTQPLVRVATPTRGEPVFTSQSAGGTTIRVYDSSAGRNIGYSGGLSARFTDTALQNRILYLVKNASAATQDVTLIFWVRLGTNDSDNDSGSSTAWRDRTLLLIDRYRSAGAAVGVHPHFVLDSPSDPGTLPGPSYGQAAKFDNIEAGNALAAAARDRPWSRVVSINKRNVLNFRDPGANGTLRGPYNSSTNTVGGIVDEATDVHLNRIGAEIEVDGIWDSAANEFPVPSDATLGLTTPPAMPDQYADKRPFFWIQPFGGENFRGLDGNYLSDPVTWVRTKLDQAVRAGYERVVLHVPGGSVVTQDYYGADQRWHLQNSVELAAHYTYFNGGGYAADLRARGLTSDVYLGIVWEPPTNPAGSFEPPMLDPKVERSWIDSQVIWWKTTVGCKNVWFDAASVFGENATRLQKIRQLRDYIYGKGMGVAGGEAIPVINSGTWQIDLARAFDMPYLVTETALAGLTNNANYRVPAGAVMFCVMTAAEATPTNITKRINQGFIVVPFQDVTTVVAQGMLSTQDQTTGRNRDRTRRRRMGLGKSRKGARPCTLA